MDPNRSVLALPRINLCAFGAAMRPSFDASAAHIRILAARLQAVERGEIERLIIAMPPRHGKSYMTTELFPAWFLGRRPGGFIISAACTQELSDRFGRSVRNLMIDPRFSAVFPNSRLSDDSSAVSRFSTRAGGEYFGIGRGGAVVGRGADLLIIDDPIRDAQEAGSANIRSQLHQWYSEVAYTRLHPGAGVIIISTRWHEDDLVGWLLREHREEGWRVLSLPATAERDEGWRKEGEPLWPERYSTETLQQIRTQIGGAAFASQYQQRPAPAGGAIFRREWWQYFSTPPAELSRIVLSLDCAFKGNAGNDYSAATIWGESKAGFFLLFAVRGRWEFPELKRRIFLLASEWRPHTILIEDAASGQSAIQELRDTSLPILPVKPLSGKVERANAVTPIVESGRVFLPAAAGWLADFLDEMSAFPAAAHDDFVDSATQALNYLRRNSIPRFGFISVGSAPRQGAYG